MMQTNLPGEPHPDPEPEGGSGPAPDETAESTAPELQPKDPPAPQKDSEDEDLTSGTTKEPDPKTSPAPQAPAANSTPDLENVEAKAGNAPDPNLYRTQKNKVQQSFTETTNNTTYIGAAPPGMAAALVLSVIAPAKEQLDRIPEARDRFESIAARPLVISSHHEGLPLLAAQALARCCLEVNEGASCRSAILNDEADGPALAQAVEKANPHFLVVRPLTARLLQQAHARLHLDNVGGTGTQLVILVEDSPAVADQLEGQGWEVWRLHACEELLTACDADQAARDTLAAQRGDNWPSEDSDVADLLARYIRTGGRSEIVKNLRVKQPSGSQKASKAVEEARRRKDSAVDLAALFLASQFPDAQVSEYEELMEFLLDGTRVPRPAPTTVEDSKPGAQDPIEAWELWDIDREEILHRYELSSRPGKDGADRIQFAYPSWGVAVGGALGIRHVQNWIGRLHDRHLLLLPGTSPAVVEGLISATAALFTRASKVYHEGWLLDLVRKVPALHSIYQEAAARQLRQCHDVDSFVAQLRSISIGGRNFADMLYARLAELCWRLMRDKPVVIVRFLNLLSAESSSRGMLALEIVTRLRRSEPAPDESFDACQWLEHLLATGSPDTCRALMARLLVDAKKSPAAAWVTLEMVRAWLPPPDKWRIESGTQRWSAGFLYDCYIADVDRFFFDDAEGIPEWPERLKFLTDWLLHPGVPPAMDWIIDKTGIRTPWIVLLNEIPRVTGELCIAEMLDYWNSHFAKDSLAGRRVDELLAQIHAGLPVPDGKAGDPPERPVRRELWLGLCCLRDAWANAAKRASKDSHPEWAKRRNDAHDLAKFFNTSPPKEPPH